MNEKIKKSHKECSSIELDDYISDVLKKVEEGVDVEFTIHLTASGSVSDEPTGNMVKFTMCNINGSTGNNDLSI